MTQAYKDKLKKRYIKLLQNEKRYFDLQDKINNFIGLTSEEWGEYRKLKTNIRIAYNDLKGY